MLILYTISYMILCVDVVYDKTYYIVLTHTYSCHQALFPNLLLDKVMQSGLALI